MPEITRDAWGVPTLRAGSHQELAHLQGAVTAQDRRDQLAEERRRALGTTAAVHGASGVAWDRFARQTMLADTAQRCFATLSPDTASWVAAFSDGVRSTGLDWDPWTPVAVWLSHHVLFAGFPSKLWRAEVAARLGPDAVRLFATDGPAAAGSNGWLIPGAGTADGAALIGGDPHRYLEDPGVYQQVRLVCPEYDVVGLAMPGVPGVAHFGHAGSVAWAITNAMADYQDVYVAAPGQGTVQTIDVAGGSGVEVEVREDASGPVIEGRWSLRMPVRVLGSVGFDALPLLLRARTVADVSRAWDHWVEPVNVVMAADIEGGLLHRVAGAVPVRPEGHVKEDGPDWTGWHEMPTAVVEGAEVMANARGIATPLGVEFAAPHRRDRLAELLTARTDWTAESAAALHTDTLLRSAAPLLERVAQASELSVAASALQSALLAWDHHMDAGSLVAQAFSAVRHLLVLGLAEHPVLAPLRDIPPYPEVFAPWLSVPRRIGYALEHLLASDLFPAGDVERIVADALEQVAAEPSRPWGEVHRIAPWQAVPRPEEWPGVGGDHDCVLSTSSVPGVTDRCLRAPVARYVWDLGDRTRSRWVVPLGATESAPHDRDQLPLWLSGRLVPVPEES